MSRSIRMLSAGACVVVLLLGVTAARDGRAAGREAPLPPGLLENERNTIRVFRRVSDAVVFITNSQLRRSLFSLNVTEVPQRSPP